MKNMTPEPRKTLTNDTAGEALQQPTLRWVGLTTVETGATDEGYATVCPSELLTINLFMHSGFGEGEGSQIAKLV